MRLMPYLQCTLMQHDACSLTTMCMSIALQVFPLWNYKDPAHYHARINDFMTEAFASNSYMLTLDSLEEQMAAWKTHILSDDYERYFNNPLRDTTDFYTYVDKIHNNNYIIITMVGSESPAAP